jgi:hypothetical protein
MNNGTIEKVREGGAGTPTTKPKAIETKAINNLTFSTKKIKERVKEYVRIGVNNKFNIMLFKIENGELTKRPEWFDMKATDEEGKKYKADVNKLLLALSKKPYGYGVLAGEQPEGKNVFICIDVDIDTKECREGISKLLEEHLNKVGIKYYKEITKSERIHYYIVLDKITNKIESISKLPYLGNCSKFTDGKEAKGEIELLTKKPVVVYNGIINDEEPFFTQEPEINSYQTFEDFLNEWISKYKPVENKKEPEKEKETKKEEEKDKLTSEQYYSIAEAFKIIRKYRIVNGWEIDKTFTGVGFRGGISEHEKKEGLKNIWESEYDEKETERLIRLTRKKDKSTLRSLGTVIYYIRNTLNSGIELEPNEIELLEAVLNELLNRGYKDYKDYVLPEYLENVENVFLDYSNPYPGKKGGVYYKEGYFIERNINGIKKVFYIEITASEKKALYKFHTLKNIDEIGVKADIKRLIKEGNTKAHEFILNDKIEFRPSLKHKTADDIIHEMSNEVLGYSYSFNINLYKKYITKKLEEYILINGEPEPCIFSKQTGWDEDLKFFYHYALNDDYHELHKDNLLYKHKKDKIQGQEDDKQKKIVKEILQEGKLLGVLLAASTSSILIKPFNLQPLTVILSGTSGAGKTTSSLIATSLFYHSDDILITAQTTKAGFELTLSQLNSLPVLLDEGALAGGNFNLSDTIFMVSSGKGKARGRKDLSVDFKELKSNVFWTTETTDIDLLKRDGAFRRMLYLVIKSWDDLTSLFKPEERINEKYTGVGVEYIKYAIEHMEEIKKALEEEKQELNLKYKELSGLGINLYSGLILLEAFYKTKFINLRKTINKLLDEAKQRFIEKKENIVQELKDFLLANTSVKFNMVNIDGMTGEKLSNQKVWGEYDKSTGTYYILKSGLEEIIRELGKNENILKDELIKAGVLQNRVAEPKWLKSFGRTVRVFVIKFKEETEEEEETKQREVEAIETEAVETKEIETEGIETKTVETEEEASFEEKYIHDYTKRYKENPNEAVKFKESIKKYIKSGEAGELLKTVRRIRHDDVDIIQQAREQGIDVKENSLISYVISDYKAKKYCFGVNGWNYDIDYYLNLVDKLTEEIMKDIPDF